MIAVRKKPKTEDCSLDRVELEETSIENSSSENLANSQKDKLTKSKKVTPIDEEIILEPKKYILSKTDTKGIIEYGNDYFVEISGYHENELIGQNHNIIRHPDMPKIIFKLLWKRIQNRQNITALVKNLAKDGRFYWVVTDFEIKVDKVSNEIIGYFAYRIAAPRKAIEVIEPLYKKLHDIEKISGMEGSEKYLNAHLEAEGKTYDEFIDDITGKNSTMIKSLFAAMKKFFN